MYLNKAQIYGNLTRDPEVRALPSGASVASFGVATNRTWKDKDGRKQEDTQFHNVVAFGKQAEVIAQYLKKGSSVYVEGRMQTRSWDDKASGEKKYRTEIVVDNFQFGPKSAGAGSGSIGGFDSGPTRGASKPHEEVVDNGPIEYPSEDVNPEDIPF